MNPPETTWIDAPTYNHGGSGIEVDTGLGTGVGLLSRVTVSVVGERGGRKSLTVLLRDTERAALITALGGTP